MCVRVREGKMQIKVLSKDPLLFFLLLAYTEFYIIHVYTIYIYRSQFMSVTIFLRISPSHPAVLPTAERFL